MRIRVWLLFALLFTITACTAQSSANDASAPVMAGGYDDWRISIVRATGEELQSFTEAEFVYILHNTDTPYPTGLLTQVYSTINNWPSNRFYVAEGYSVAAILKAVGVYESAQTITFRGSDGYEMSLTREQLLSPQYFFPMVGESDEGAERVHPIIAYRWRDGTDDITAIRPDKPRLIIGQRNPNEHTNPVFVAQLSEIIICDAPAEEWPLATSFPPPGPIAAGETVNLQHSNFGRVKLHYTLDGTIPTILSNMFNPSTFQPELNVPITINESTTIKVLVHGYGKANSDIAVLEFSVLE